MKKLLRNPWIITIVGGLAVIVIAYLVFGIGKNIGNTTIHTPQTMENSGGGVQIQGDNNVVNPVPDAGVRYATTSVVTVDRNGIYNYEFRVDIFLPPYHSGNYEIGVAPGLSCIDSGPGSYGGLRSGGEFGTTQMSVFRHFLECTSTSFIPDNGQLFWYEGEL